MSKRIIRVVEQICFYGILLGLWQFIYWLFVEQLNWMKPYVVPSPVKVYQSAIAMVEENTLFQAIGNSMMRCISGFVIAILLGLFLGLLIHTIPLLQRTLKPMILGIQTLPSICWVPFAIIWFGIDGSAPILFVVVMGSAFSFSLAVDSAIRNVDPIYIKVSKTMGASKKMIYSKVIFHACLPNLIVGLKQAWSFAWRALMTAEVMVTCVGLGFSLNWARQLADIDQVTLIMVVIVILGVLIDKCVFTTWENHILKKRGL